MLKKTILFLTIIFTFFLQPAIFSNTNYHSDLLIVQAEEGNSGNNANKTKKPDNLPWWISWYINKLQNIIFRYMTIKDYFTKDFTVQLENTSDQLTDYKSVKKDTSFRITPQKNQEQQKGVWFYEVITEATATGGEPKKKYKNEYSFEIPNGCPEEIDQISDIVWYFYNKGEEKILYSPENYNDPVDYPPEINNFETPPLNHEFDYCYEYAYKNIQPIPHGEFLPDSNQNNYYIDAATASIQNNRSLSLNLPQNTQNELGDCPTTNNTQEEIEAVMHNSELKKLAANRFQMPQKGQDAIDIDDSIYEIADKTFFNKEDPNEPENILLNATRLWLTPQKWQKETSIAASNNSNLTIVYNQKNNSQTTPNNSQITNLSMVYISN